MNPRAARVRRLKERLEFETDPRVRESIEAQRSRSPAVAGKRDRTVAPFGSELDETQAQTRITPIGPLPMVAESPA